MINVFTRARWTLDEAIRYGYAIAPSRTINKEVCPGFDCTKYMVYNRDKIISEQNLQIYIFHNKLIAEYLSNITNNSLPFIPSSFGGKYTDIRSVDIADLKYRDIVIVPLPSIESFSSLYEQAKFLMDNSVNSVKISTNCPILPTHLPVEGGQYNTFDKLLVNIIEDVFILDNDFINYFDYSRIKSLENFATWANKHGLVIGDKTKAFESIDLLARSDTKSEAEPEIFYMDKLFLPDTIATCVAESRTGKTHFATTIGLAYVSGFDVLGLKKNWRDEILYFDSDMDVASFGQKIFYQLMYAYKCRRDDVRNFHYHNPPAQGYNLDFLVKDDLDSNSQNQLSEFLNNSKIKLIIFDNIRSLFPSAIYSTKSWNILTKNLRKLSRKYGFGILFLHHTNKENELAGNQGIFDLSSTVIRLDRIDLEDDVSSCFELIYDKCRAYPYLCNIRNSYKLQYHIDAKDATPWELYNHSDDISNLFNCDAKPIHKAIIKALLDYHPLSASEIAQRIKEPNGKLLNPKTITNHIKEINEFPLHYGINKVGSGPSTVYEAYLKNNGANQ